MKDNAIDIMKGVKVDISKVAPGLRTARIAASWDANKTPGGHRFDMDISLVCCDENDNPVGLPTSFVFYKNFSNSNKSIIVLRDEQSGETEGYDEEAFIKFNEVPAEVKKIYACVSIAFFKTRKQNFGQITKARLDMYDEDTRERLITFDLAEDMSSGTGCKAIRFMREANGGWSYKAVAEIVDGGLPGVLGSFGIAVKGDE